MRIGIDIDDTIAHTMDSMLHYADKYDIEILGNKGNNGNIGNIIDHHYLKELYGWDEDTKYNFFSMYYKNVIEDCKPKVDAVEIIKKLKQEGNEIFYITARLDSFKDYSIYDITKKWLEDNEFPVDYLKVSVANKLEVCKKENIDVFIDDSYKNCESVYETVSKSILITTPMNQKINEQNILRAKDWYEIYKFIEKN